MTDTPTRTEPKKELDVDRDLAVKLYEVMVLTRAVEDRMVAMYRGGDLLGSLYTGHWHEAISVGAASCLRPDDHMAPLHRNLGAHLWKGMEPWQIMASFMGKAIAARRKALADPMPEAGNIEEGVHAP